jgi:hypothetical protein
MISRLERAGYLASMPSHPLRLAAMIAVVASAALGPSPARAAEGGLAQLRQVFAEGRQLEDKGHWAEALDKFKEVAATKMTPQVRFHIALCEENLGKLVSAMKGFDLAAAEGTAAGSSAVEVPPAAKEHVEALRARVAKIHLEVHGKPRTSKIVLDDAPLGDKELGADVEVDPGSHVVEVRQASGKVTFHKELTLEEKGSETLEVTVADPDEGPVNPPPPPPPAPASRLPAYVTGGAGLVVLAGSGVFFALRASNIATVAAHCAADGTHCDPSYQSLAGQGQVYNGLADALLGIGLAGVAAGTVLFFVLPAKKPASSTTRRDLKGRLADLRVVPSPAGLRVSGAF